MSIDPRALLALVPDDELMAEVERRNLRKPAGVALQVHGLTVDPLARTAKWRGRTVGLSYREAEVLYALALSRWQGVDSLRSERLAVKVWRVHDVDTRNALHVALSRLRAKLPGLLVTYRASSTTPGRYGLNLDAQEVAA